MADQIRERLEPPEVSVIVCTHNRRELVCQALESLFVQTYLADRFEILLMDDCSTDGTADAVARLQHRSPVMLSYHRTATNIGVAKSRNAAAQIARGRFLAFLDNDAVADPHWLETAIAAFGPGVAFVTGPVLDKPNQRVTFFSRSNSTGVAEHPSYPACNAVYDKRIYFELGGLDETLCFQSIWNMSVECADTDLAWRAKARGYKNVFVPRSIVYHEVEKLDFRRWLTYPSRLFVVPAAVKRHPQLRTAMLRHRLFFLADHPAYYAFLAGVSAGAIWHPAATVLAVPYLVRVARYLNWGVSPIQILKGMVQMLLIAVQQTIAMAALMYGSLRFRTLVL